MLLNMSTYGWVMLADKPVALNMAQRYLESTLSCKDSLALDCLKKGIPVNRGVHTMPKATLRRLTL